LQHRQRCGSLYVATLCDEERQLRHFSCSSGRKRGNARGGGASSWPPDGPHERTLRQPLASRAEKRSQAPQVGYGPSLRWVGQRCAQPREPRPVPLSPSLPRTGSMWMNHGRGQRGLWLCHPCTAPALAAPLCERPATLAGRVPIARGNVLGCCWPHRATSRYGVGEAIGACSASEASRRSSSAQ
jgi:hypothetical protein